MKKTGVIGIGNTLMQDDGIGPKLLNRLKDRKEFEELIFTDLGTGGMNLLHVLSPLSQAIIIDSGDIGKEPGEFKFFPPDSATSEKFLPGQSLHEFDLLKTLELAKQLGESPEKLIIMAIQPESMEWGEQLSKTLEQKMDLYEQALAEELKQLSES